MIDHNIIFLILGIIIIIWLACNTNHGDREKIETYAPIDYNSFTDYDSDFYPGAHSGFDAQYDSPYAPESPYPSYPSVGWLSSQGLLPWWNSTRNTRNMSYDIRGDIPPIIHPVGPWHISPVL
jgi:hypothetical protein